MSWKIIAFSTALLTLFWSVSIAQSGAAVIDQPLHPFSLKDAEGKLITNEDLTNKVVLINFWFTTCAPCIAEMPTLNDLRAAFDPDEVVMLSMAPDSKEEVLAFLEKHAFTFHHIPAAGEYIANFGIGYPKNILVDKKGRVRYVEGGIALLRLNRESREREYLIDASLLSRKIALLLAE